MSDRGVLHRIDPHFAVLPVKHRRLRVAALLASLGLLLAVPLATPATADDGRIELSAILDTPELLAMINGGDSPGTLVTYSIFDAAGEGLTPVATETSDETFGAPVSFLLDDGHYKISASADGYLPSWFSSTAGAGNEGFTELLAYQAGGDFASAGVIDVDTATQGGPSWTSTGWTVLHKYASSISGAVGNDPAGPADSLLEGVAVDLYDSAGALGSPVATTTTDANGYFTFPISSPGSYQVRFDDGTLSKWWPETTNRAEADMIVLDGTNYFNLAYAIMPTGTVPVDPQRVLTLSGEPAPGATLTATPDYVEVGGLNQNCLQRYTWLTDGVGVDGAFGSTFVIPPTAAGKTVTARLDIVGLGCTYTALLSNSRGPVNPNLTLPGGPVTVSPEDVAGDLDVMLKFGTVTGAGTTTLSATDPGEIPVPTGFSVLTDPPLTFKLETTAVFSGGVEVCISLASSGLAAAQAVQQRLYHYVNGNWDDITNFQSAERVCGITTSFSPFAVGQPWWPFRGFLQPVDNGNMNAMKAGAAVPIKFSLGGSRGLGILRNGAPTSSSVACSNASAADDIEQTVDAGNSSLRYAQGSDTYSYIWKTDKAWAGTCRQFVMTLTDGTVHRALFDFRK